MIRVLVYDDHVLAGDAPDNFLPRRNELVNWNGRLRRVTDVEWSVKNDTTVVKIQLGLTNNPQEAP